MPINSFPATTMQAAAVATGNGSALDLDGRAAATMQVAGITTATITWEATTDGSTWVGVAVQNLNSTTRAAALTATADGLYHFQAAPGVKQLRARISAYTSGTITVTGVAG